MLIPFIIGVVIGDYLFFEGIAIPLRLFLSLIPLSLLLLFTIYRTVHRFADRWMFGFCTFCTLLLWGACWTNIYVQQSTFHYPSDETVYRVSVTDTPEVKENSILCRAQVQEKSVLLYFPLDSMGKVIRRGDELLISARLSLPASRGNPDEFDYRQYIMRKGVAGTAYVNSGKWQIVSNQTAGSIRNYALGYRDRVLELYRELGFEGDEFAVLSALTVGYKDELSEEIRESFAASGASHILALSGLHLGIIYVFLFFFLQKIPGTSVLAEALKVCLLLLVLWAFAIMTGLSPSVVRSVIMFSLLGISQVFSMRPVTLNTLAVAALGMLVYNPCWLFDVGFQLSFTAVIAILLIQPWMYRQLKIRHTILDKLWGLTTVSIAAQIGTAPLVLFYFSRFPVHFLLTNILVVPLVTLIIYIAIAMLLLSFVPLLGHGIAYILNLLLKLLNGIALGVENLPFATIDRIWIYHLEVVSIYLVLSLLFWYIIVRRQARFLIMGLSLILITCVCRIVVTEAERPQQSIVFYNVRNCPAVHFISSNGRSWLAYADSVPDEKRLLRTTSNHWNRLDLSPMPITGNYNDTQFKRNDDIISFAGKRVCIVNDNRWQNKKADLLLPVDHLYLCKGYNGKIERLTELLLIRHIVIDPSVSDYRRALFLDECNRLGIPCLSLSDEASYYKDLI